jgi:hypothetical protein
VADVKYDDDRKAKVQAAFELALDRLGLLRRKPTYWEADCLSKALMAIRRRNYGLVQSMINCSLSPPLDGWQAPAAATDLSLPELRAQLARTVSRADKNAVQAAA